MAPLGGQGVGTVAVTDGRETGGNSSAGRHGRDHPVHPLPTTDAILVVSLQRGVGQMFVSSGGVTLGSGKVPVPARPVVGSGAWVSTTYDVIESPP